MMGGFLALAFNPHAWIALAVAAVLSFSGGVVKGWNASNADHWRQQAEALAEAAEHKDRLTRADAARAEIDRAAHAREKAELEKIIEQTRNSGACRLSSDELERLYKLASGPGGNGVPVPGARR